MSGRANTLACGVVPFGSKEALDKLALVMSVPNVRRGSEKLGNCAFVFDGSNEGCDACTNPRTVLAIFRT